MFRAFVLVRNLESSAVSLDFDEFTINRVGLRFQELKNAEVRKAVAAKIASLEGDGA
jgi:hypothetical protein